MVSVAILATMMFSGTLRAQAPTPRETPNAAPRLPAAYRAAEDASLTLEGASNLVAPPSARATTLLAVERHLALGQLPQVTTSTQADVDVRANTETRATARLRAIDRLFATIHSFAPAQSQEDAENNESIVGELSVDGTLSSVLYLWDADGVSGGLPPDALSTVQEQWVAERLTVQVRTPGDERELFWLEALCPVVARAESTGQGPRTDEDEEERLIGFASEQEAIRALRPVLEQDPSREAQACLAELEGLERVDEADPSEVP